MSRKLLSHSIPPEEYDDVYIYKTIDIRKAETKKALFTTISDGDLLAYLRNLSRSWKSYQYATTFIKLKGQIVTRFEEMKLFSEVQNSEGKIKIKVAENIVTTFTELVE